MHEFLWDFIADPSTQFRLASDQPKPMLELAPPQPFEEAIAPVYSSVVRILGRIFREYPEVDDLIQESLVYLWQQWKLNTLLFEEQPLPFLVGMAKRGGTSRYIDREKGRTKFDAGSLDDPETLRQSSVRKKTVGYGREVYLAELRVDLSAAARQIYDKYQTRQVPGFTAKKRERIEIIFKDFLDGREAFESAAAVDMSTKGVMRWRTLFREEFREQLPDYGGTEERNKRPYTDAEVAQLLELAAQGLTYRQIATKVGRSRSSVSTKLCDLRAAEGKSPGKLEVLPLAGD